MKNSKEKKETKMEVRQEFYQGFDRDYFDGDVDFVWKKMRDIPKVLKERYDKRIEEINSYEIKTKAHLRAREDTLKSMESQDPSRYHRFDINLEDGHYEGDSPEYKIHGVRLETDEEYSDRIQRSEAASKAAKIAAKTKADKKKEAELAEYFRLKKKFENV